MERDGFLYKYELGNLLNVFCQPGMKADNRGSPSTKNKLISNLEMCGPSLIIMEELSQMGKIAAFSVPLSSGPGSKLDVFVAIEAAMFPNQAREAFRP